MTTTTSNDDLVAKLRRAHRMSVSDVTDPNARTLWGDAAVALEAAEREKAEAWRVASEQTRMERDRAEVAEQRAEEAEREMHARELHHFEEEERAAGLAAVIEKVRERAESIRRDYAALERHEADNVDRGMSLAASLILRDVEASAPADVLRERDAQVRAEAAVQTLRVAAREAEAWRAADGMNGGEWFPSKWAGQVAGWLEHRADTLERAARIEKEQDQ